MSYITNRKRKPPMSEAQLKLLNLLALAQTVGARRAIALLVKDGKYSDGRTLGVHWKVLKEAKEKYELERDDILKLLGPGEVV